MVFYTCSSRLSPHRHPIIIQKHAQAMLKTQDTHIRQVKNTRTHALKPNVLLHGRDVALSDYKHPHIACLIYIFFYYYFVCVLSAASLFSFLCVIYFLLQLPYIYPFFFYLISYLKCSVLKAGPKAYTKVPHTNIKHTLRR